MQILHWLHNICYQVQSFLISFTYFPRFLCFYLCSVSLLCHFLQFCFYTLLFHSVIWLFVFHLVYIIHCHVVFCSFLSPSSEPFPASLLSQTTGRGSQNIVSYSAQFLPRQKLINAKLVIGCVSLLHFPFHSRLALCSLYSSPCVLSLALSLSAADLWDSNMCQHACLRITYLNSDMLILIYTLIDLRNLRHHLSKGPPLIVLNSPARLPAVYSVEWFSVKVELNVKAFEIMTFGGTFLTNKKISKVLCISCAISIIKKTMVKFPHYVVFNIFYCFYCVHVRQRLISFPVETTQFIYFIL